MKIEFESREEIQRLATVLQNNVYPAPIIIDTGDLLDACHGSGDKPLPWNTDGFHFPITIGSRKTDEEGNRLYTHEEVFGRGTVWEEVEQDGKTYLRRVISGDTPFLREEEMLFLAGQLDAWFQCMQVGQAAMTDVAKITGQPESLLFDMYRIWNRRMSGKNCGRMWFKAHLDGSYSITEMPGEEDS